MLKEIIITAVIVAGMGLGDMLSKMFLKKVKEKLAPATLKKYRFWFVETALLILILFISISLIITSVINGKGSEALFPVFRGGAALFAVLSVVNLFKICFKAKEKNYTTEQLMGKEKTYTQEQLEKMYRSESFYERTIAASQRYKLDVLINDPSPYVRAQVVRQGYGLDKLIEDKDDLVRARVALQGYGLDVLKNDKSLLVRNAAKKMIKKNKT